MRYQSMQRVIALLVCVVGLLSSCVQHAFAADDVLAQVTGIFAAVERPSENKSPTEPAYIRLQKLKPGETASDPACYAYLLGLVELRKQREAIGYAGELIQRNVHEVRCRLLRARLLLREKKFAEAFVDLETAGRLLAEQTRKETLDAETEASCRAMGLMFGYIEGPAKPLVKATLGKGVKDRLMYNFSAAAKKSFNEQYDAVLEEQKELIDKGEDAFREKQAKHREEIEAAAERRAKLEAQTTEAEQKKQVQIDQLTKKWEAAKAEYDRRAAAYLDLQNAQAQLIAQRGLLANQAAAARPREPERDKDGYISSGEQDRYNRESQRYNQMVRQVNMADQQILQGTAALQQQWNQGAIAEAGLVRLQTEGERLGVEFSLKERAFAKQEARLNRNDPRKKKLPTAPLKHLEQTFAQYDDFNYLQEKQRLLDSLRAAK
jgi:hypothetical protein